MQEAGMQVWLGSVATALVVAGLTASAWQGGAAGRGGGASTAQPPAAPPVSSRPAVDPAAYERGRAIWARECIDCHGSTARGSDTGPNIIRTKTVNFDRSSANPGSVLGPFLKAGHTTQSGKASATFTDAEIVELSHFVRQKVNDTMRGSPLFTVGDILVGDKAAGEAYFNGVGKCATCHTATSRSLAGIGARLPAPVDIQQRMLFPGGRGRGGVPGPTATTVTITPASGPAVSGVLVEQSDFYVTVRQADGTVKAVRRAPGMQVVVTSPLQAHIDLLDEITDAQIHNVVAYLESLK
jgi:cytochrome c oxidase cbb3-type subunit 3